MAQIVYNEKLVVEHAIARKDCICLLDQLAEKDYHRDGYFDKRIKCLSLDDYEEKVCGGSKDNTMDAAIGIYDYLNNRTVNSRLMLVELRMGYDSADNLSKGSLEHKIGHSRDLLSDTRVDKVNIFIFTDGVAPKAKSWATRMAHASSVNPDWEMLGVSQFNELLKFESDMPYQPIHDVEHIMGGLTLCIEQKDWKILFQTTKYWIEQAEKYRLKYNKSEFISILNVLWQVWQTVNPQIYGLDEENEISIEMEIWKEDIYNLIKTVKSV